MKKDAFVWGIYGFACGGGGGLWAYDHLSIFQPHNLTQFVIHSLSNDAVSRIKNLYTDGLVGPPLFYQLKRFSNCPHDMNN